MHESDRAVWESLTDRQKRATIARVLKRRHASLRKTPRFVAAICGYRRSSSTNQRGFSDELALRILVRRKWKPDSRRSKGKIPPFFLTYVTVKGKRRRCAVPTDVDDVAGVRNQVGAKVQVGTRTGCVSCMVQANGTNFAVSCQHVFAGFPNAVLGKCVDFYNAGSTPSKPVKSRLSCGVRIANVIRGRSLDIALAECPADKLVALQILLPSVTGALSKGVPLPQSVVVATHRKKIVRGRKLSPSPRPNSPVDGQGNVMFEQFIEYEAATEHGDSGSAVLDPTTNKLVGIHFAGNEQTGIAYMLPAWLLLEANYFDLPIRLVKVP